MAIDTKLLEITPVSELTEVTGLQEGSLLFYDGSNKLKRISLETFNNLSKTAKPIGLSDVAPTISGLYKPKTAGTYANAGGLIAQEGYDTLFFFNGTTWTKSESKFPQASPNLRLWSALPFSKDEQVVKDNVIYIALENVLATDVPGVSDRWKSLGGKMPEEINRDFNESYFPIAGLYEDAGDELYYKNTGRIKISAGTLVTAHISGDGAWAPKVAGIIVIKNNAVIHRIYTGNPGAWVNLTYTATEDVEIVINHRIAAFASGYYYHIFYKPFYGMKDLNVDGGVLGYDIYKNAIHSTKAYTIEDDYVWKKGQVLLNGNIEDANGIERRTDYLPVVQGQVITADSYMGTNANVISFYNNAGTFLGGIAGNGYDANTYVATAPQNGYVIICTYVMANFVGNFRGVDVPLILKKIITENNIDAPAGIASVTTGAVKKAFDIPRLAPTNGLLSIIDDDGNANVISYLLPFMQSKGLPIGLAIAGKLIVDGNLDGRPSMTNAQLVGLKDNPLVEIMNHTYSHAALGNPTKFFAYDELKRNHDWLLERGIIAESFVSPYGSYNLTTIQMINKLYDSHYSTYPDTNTAINMKNLEIGRLNFGLDGVTLQTLKNAVDRAKARNEYLVIMTHVGGYNDYTNWRADFENLVEYIIASGITVAKPTDAFNRYKNMFERYGDYKIGADGLKRKY